MPALIRWFAAFLVVSTAATSLSFGQEFDDSIIDASSLTGSEDFLDQAYSVGAIGDSITTAFNSSGFGDNKPYSWSTGNDRGAKSQSHAVRLKKLLGRSIVVSNQAVTGAVAKDLNAQVGKLLAAKPDYVTVLIGANDLCGLNTKKPEETISKAQFVDAAITRLIASNASIKILVSAIPNMMRLRDLGVQNGCQGKWNTYGICKPLLSNKVSVEDRQIFSDTYAAFNRELSAIAQKYPENVRFNDAVETFEFTWDLVSGMDCFHPSLAGQNRLADLTFESDWF